MFGYDYAIPPCKSSRYYTKHTAPLRDLEQRDRSDQRVCLGGDEDVK